MTMSCIAKVKATMTAKNNSTIEILVALIAIIVAMTVKRIANCFLPEPVIDLGKHAFAGFLQGWDAGKASNNCMVSPQI